MTMRCQEKNNPRREITIGRQIRKKRNILKLTQRQLAKKVGLSQKDISRIETGESEKISESVLRKFSEVLQEPISYFYGEEKRTPIFEEISKTPPVFIVLQVTPKDIHIVEKLLKLIKKS